MAGFDRVGARAGRRGLVLGACVLLAAGAARAEDAPLPDLQTCMDIEADRYEWRLDVLRHRPEEAQDFDIGEVLGVEYCGNIAITLCDRSDDPIACQAVLTRDQLALGAAVLGDLPPPRPRSTEAQTAADADTDEAERLYARTYALAHGVSAGPDCAGAPELMAAWCAAREANNALQNAVLAWQVARYLGLAKPAIAAGWARPPPPVRPRLRPEP